MRLSSRSLRLLPLLLTAALVLPLLSLSGCAELTKLTNSPTVQVLAPDVVNLAVAATVGTNKATAQARAQKIKDVATKILADETALTSMATLEADINAEIAKANLPGPDLILAQELAAALELSANAYLSATGKGVAVSTVAVEISNVLNQVITEAKAFGAV